MSTLKQMQIFSWMFGISVALASIHASREEDAHDSKV